MQVKRSIHFLASAKDSERTDMVHLHQLGQLIHLSAELQHELQRERGLSSLFLGSAGERFGSAIREQVMLSLEAEHHLREHAQQALAARPGQARLLARMASVLRGLDALPYLRERVQGVHWTADRAIAAYVRVIGELLAVVHDAADQVGEPALARLLGATYQLMLGKEHAGQERAIGAAMYASGRGSAEQQQRLRQLIEAQRRCLGAFTASAPAALRGQWQQLQQGEVTAELQRMRQALGGAGLNDIDVGLCDDWFCCCSRRINELKSMEEAMVAQLLDACRQRLAGLQTEWQALQGLCERAPTAAHSHGAMLAAGRAYFEPTSADHGQVQRA